MEQKKNIYTDTTGVSPVNTNLRNISEKAAISAKLRKNYLLLKFPQFLGFSIYHRLDRVISGRTLIDSLAVLNRTQNHIAATMPPDMRDPTLPNRNL